MAEKQLCFLYLVNDVLQTCRKEAPAYREEFARILPAALATYAATAPPPLVAKAKRTVDVWRARNVLPAAALAALGRCFPSASASASASRAAAPAPAPAPAPAARVPAAFKVRCPPLAAAQV